MTMSSCAGTHAMAMRQPLSLTVSTTSSTRCLATAAKRVKSLAGATLGRSVRVGGRPDRQGLALARGRRTKHAVKQVDRLLSNQGIDVDDLLGGCLRGRQRDITVAMD